MGALRHLQSEVAVHSKTRQCEQYHQGGESHDGAKDAGTASAVDERLPPNSSYLPCNAEKDRCRGDTLYSVDREIEKQSSRGYITPKVKAKSKAAAAPRATSSTPSSTASTWDLVQASPASPSQLAQEMQQHLTAEEKEQIMKIVQERRQQARAPREVTTDLAGAYESEMS